MKNIFKFFFLYCFAFARHVILDDKNFVSLIGPVTELSVDHIIREWNAEDSQNYIKQNNHTILYINSPGGSVMAGNTLIQYIQTLQAQNITVDCVAQNFMSMGFIILQSCSNRLVLENSIGMQHQMIVHVRGDLENVKNLLNLYSRINDKLIDLEIKKIGIPLEDYMKNIINDWWIYGNDNLLTGTADEQISFSCSSSLYNKTLIRKEYIYGHEFYVEIPKCPLFKEVYVSNEKCKQYFNSKLYLNKAKKWIFD